MRAALLSHPIVHKLLEVLVLAAQERGEDSTIAALKRIGDYLYNEGSISFEWESNELTLASAQKKGDRKDNYYVATLESCTCPSGDQRRAALAYIAKNGSKGVQIKMCWHIQFLSVLLMVLRNAELYGEEVYDQMIVWQSVELEIQPMKVTVHA